MLTKDQDKKIPKANGTVGTTAVTGMKDRDTNTVQAVVVERTNQETLQGFVNARKAPGAKVYTDEHSGYVGLDNHESVHHQTHTNGIESFWSLLKRGCVGTYHKINVKHLAWYVNEFAGLQNVRGLDTIAQMNLLADGMDGKRHRYQDFIA